jgi:hypothetical protein
MIRQLPAGFALVIRGGCAPVIARLPRACSEAALRAVKAIHTLAWFSIEACMVYVPIRRGSPGDRTAARASPPQWWRRRA